MNNSTSTKIGITILRVALAFVFLWFGFSQLSDIGIWTSFVPQSAMTITGMSAGTLVLLNGILEVIAGILLAFGIFTRVVGTILGIHLLIIALSMGLTAIGVRDIGLALATIALGFLGGGELALMTKLPEKLTITSIH